MSLYTMHHIYISNALNMSTAQEVHHWELCEGCRVDWRVTQLIWQSTESLIQPAIAMSRQPNMMSCCCGTVCW